MRKVLSFNDKWAFSKETKQFPQALPKNWVWVNLPHTWNDIDGMDGGNDYYRGTCLYAKTVDKAEFLPSADKYFIEIQGANSSADLYVNGEHIAHHDGGYSTWRADVTRQFKRVSEPLVVIAVDNTANETVYPQLADFTFYGGLYRDVNIICTDESHFDLEFYGGPGIKVTPKIEDKNADVEIEVFVKNPQDDMKLVYTVKKACGCVVEEKTLPVTETKTNVTISNVHLWHGVKDPYLYTAEVKLMSGNTEVDCVKTKFGCRTFRIDREEGFLLNGEYYPLRGVSRHQDRWGKGNALSKEDHIEDIELICEMGANTIRLAHYQHDQFFYDLCDEKGLVIWAEIPYISKHMPTARENTITQMKELLAQNYNHPSIVVWGLSNEITMQGSTPDLVENHVILNDLCHEWDPTRLTTIACVSMTDMNDPYVKIPDVVAYNHYFGWYGGDTSMNGPWMDKFHAANPDIPIGMSEYGCEALNWHTSDPKQGDYTEEYQAYYHEELIKQLFTRKYIWATHVWNMFDFGADGRNEGGENGQNHKGLITIDRKYKKDSFYAYKAWLSDDPFVHICSKRYVDRVEDVTKVTVYSNQPEVELFANDVSLGKQTSDVHFFYFDVPNKGVTKLKAVVGDCTDYSEIRKVDEFNEAYLLKEKGAILNWFDVTEVEGMYSINDKLSDLNKNPQASAVFAEMMKQAMESKGEEGRSQMTAMMNGPMADMMGGFTVLRMSTVMGTMGAVFTKEILLSANEKLNKIKK
ncbi:MAG: glycoside hydrolase family 2 protein [Oscillospiraceae bacterium]|nr:glycoside hydrolase family 2 protein [Oscillospiraceae bacterium]